MNEVRIYFLQLAIALAIGIVIGIERGWQDRAAREGERIAGLRTYGLIGLLGGSSALLARELGAIIFAFAFIGLTATLIVAYSLKTRQGDDVGITSLIAALLAYLLGALAVAGHEGVAAAAAVVAALLLNYKSQLHQWVSALKARELRAGLHLLLISVVALPLLPNRGYGPYAALNPYEIWWMVVLIALISFIGYFAIKIGGVRKGTLFTSLSGGLASSTALTLHFARQAREKTSLVPLLAMGTLIACGTMFPRMLLVASLIEPALLPRLLPAGVIMAFAVFVPALLTWRSNAPGDVEVEAPLRNPLELTAALSFGALLAIIMLLGRALQAVYGETGIFALAAASGIADVDAITLSLSRMSSQGLALDIAVVGIVLAAAVNTVAKAVMAALIGGRRMAMRVGAPLITAAIAGPVVVWITGF